MKLLNIKKSLGILTLSFKTINKFINKSKSKSQTGSKKILSDILFGFLYESMKKAENISKYDKAIEYEVIIVGENS